MTVSLATLPFDVVVAFAVFCRVGALFMTAPAFGDFSLIPRLRLVAALSVSAALIPVASGFYPAQLAGMAITDLSGLVALIFGEIVFGAFLGLMARTFVAALNVAGQIIAFQIGLSLAQIFDPTQELQGAIVGGFLAVFGTTLIFATNLHHGLIMAVSDSWILFQPGTIPAFGDMSQALVETISSAFALGFRLAAPFIVFGLVFYIGAGVLNRLMPQAQVFFMLLPANLALGLMMLMLTIGLIMTTFLNEFEIFLLRFIGG